MFDTLSAFLKEILEKVDFVINPQKVKSMQNYSAFRVKYWRYMCWIQTDGIRPDGIPEMIFRKLKLEKNQQTTKKHAKICLKLAMQVMRTKILGT